MKYVVSGADGFIGSHLIRRLLSDGVPPASIIAGVYDLEGSRAKIMAISDKIEVRSLDVLDTDSCLCALEGADCAYFLVHMLQKKDFVEAEARSAEVFSKAAAAQGVSRVIYMSGLGSDSTKLSPHLLSRHRTGDILRSGKVPTIEFRASLVMGKGGLSFDIIHELVSRLPIMTVPGYCLTKTQPIRMEDVLSYLTAAAAVELKESVIVEIGGPAVMTYVDMLRDYGALLGKRRYFIVIPFLPTFVSAWWFNLFTPGQAKIGKHLAESLHNEMVVTNDVALKMFPNINPAPVFSAPFN